MDISYCLVDSSELIKVTIAGHFDRDATTKACAELATGISQRDTKGVLHLREFKCDMSVADVYEVCSNLAGALPAHQQRMAVLLGQDAAKREFDLANFMSLCGQNRGLPIRPFTDKDEAIGWLESRSKG